MAGRAAVDYYHRDTIPGVFLLTGDSIRRWEPAANPLNKYSTIRKKIEMQELGLGYIFAQQMRLNYPDKEIGLVVNARGGTSIRKWMPGTEYYNEAVKRTKTAMENGSLKGIIWLQGEGDLSRVTSYLDSLISIITSLRNDFHQPDLPFIASELSEDKARRIPFNEMLMKLPDRLNRTAVISSSGTSTIDSTHFDTRSQVLLGVRASQQMYYLLNN